MNFDRFPLLVQIKILSFLNVKERLEIKSVSRLLKALIEQFLPLKSLCIYRSYKPGKWNWPFTEEVIEDQVMIQAHFHQGEHGVDFSKAYFRNLKRLHVHGDLVSKGPNLLKHINLLEELEVLSAYLSYDYGLNNINLRNLKVLSFWDCNSDWRKTVFFGMPNLKRFSFFKDGAFYYETKFGNPEKLEVFRCQAFGPKFTVNKLVGLKHLICQDLDSSFQLEEYPSLRLLEAFPSRGETTRILKNREMQFPKDLKVFVFGFSLANLPEVFIKTDEFVGFKSPNCWLSDNFLSYIANNYPNLERPCLWPIGLSYSLLFKSFCGRVPEDFLKFYPNIARLDVSERTDCSRLIRFLKNHGEIETLSLFDDCLDQNFFEELGSISSPLNCLVIREFTKNVDFSFASKLENLTTIYYCFGSKIIIPNESFEPLEQCKNLKTVKFYLTRSHVAWHFYGAIEISYKNGKRNYISEVDEIVYEGECIKKAIDCINANV